MSKVIVVEGVGINDTSLCGPHYVWDKDKQDSVPTPEYKMWYDMIRRCYSSKLKSSVNSLHKSKCCEAWLQRSEFQKWYFDQHCYLDNQGNKLHLDKDILSPVGESLYSPETCCLVPQYLNASVSKDLRSKVTRDSGLPLWVSYREKDLDMVNEYSRPYRAKVSFMHKPKRFGSYSNPLDAHRAGQMGKIESLEQIILQYRKEECYRIDVEFALQQIIDRILDDHLNNRITPH